MYTDTDWEEKKYKTIFERTCRYVNNRKSREKNFSVKDLEKMLDDAYIRRGNDWVGKGPLKNIEESAIIAAFEHKIAEWKKEK